MHFLDRARCGKSGKLRLATGPTRKVVADLRTPTTDYLSPRKLATTWRDMPIPFALEASRWISTLLSDMIFCQTIEATTLGELTKALQSSPAGATLWRRT
jgi:hypothetical protein